MDALKTRRVSQAVRRRLLIASVIGRSGRGLTLGGVLGLAWVLLTRLGPISLADLPWWAGLGVIVGLGGCAGAGWGWLAGRRTLLEAAQLADRSTDLRDRLSNGLHFASSGKPSASEQLAVRESERVADRVRPGVVAPVRFGSSWAIWPLVLGAAVTCGVFVPTRESTTVVEAANAASEQREREDAAEVLADAARVAEEASRTLGDRATPVELDRMNEIERELLESGRDPAEALAESAGELQSLADRVENDAEVSELADEQARENLARSFGPSETDGALSEALAQGDLERAREIAEQMFEQRDRMSAEERERFAQELERLSQHADRAAERDTDQSPIAEELLREQGVEDNEVADSTDAAPIRDALEREGVEPEAAQRIADDLAARNREEQARREASEDLAELADAARDAAQELREDDPAHSPTDPDRREPDPNEPDPKKPNSDDSVPTSTDQPQAEQPETPHEQDSQTPPDEQPPPPSEPEQGRQQQDQQQPGQQQSQQQGEQQDQDRQQQDQQQPGQQQSQRQGEQQEQGRQQQDQQQPGQQQSQQQGEQQEQGRQQQDQQQPGQQQSQQQGEQQEQGRQQQDQQQPGQQQSQQQGEQQEQGRQQQDQQQPGQQSQQQGEQQEQGRQQQDQQQPGQQQSQQQGEQQEQGRQQQDQQQPGQRESDQPDSAGRAEERLTDGQGQAPEPGGAERFRRQLERMAERGREAEQGRESAQELRERAERMLEQASPEERRRLEDMARELAEQGDERRQSQEPNARARPNEGPRATESQDWTYEDLDAEGTPSGEPNEGRVIADWLKDGSESPTGQRRSAGQSGSALREAARGAEKAVERSAVPRERQDLVRRVFERFRQRAQEAAESDGGNDSGDR